jgi:hypothetical protein
MLTPLATFCAHAVVEIVAAWALKTCPPYQAWSFIDHVFSKPISVGDRKIDYVPTQVLTEFFKSQGYDGIGYTSSLGEGQNLALFDLDAAVPINCRLYRTSEITCKFADLERSTPYGKD